MKDDGYRYGNELIVQIKIQVKLQNMQLGQQVLDKISNLLVEIDRPKSPKRPQRVSKQTENQRVSMNNNNDRLYQNYKRMKDQAHEKEKDRLKQQLEKMQPFRVENKHSIFLNSRKNVKPLHQRTSEIIRQRQLSIEKKRTELQLERERRKELTQMEDEEELNAQNLRFKPQRKINSKQELDQIIRRLTNRERDRMDKVNKEKMEYLKQKLLNNMEKPTMNKKSERIWQKVRNEKDLSPNVFERFEKYVWDYKKKHQIYVNKRKQIETPFHPEISKNSKQILNKSGISRIQLTKDLDRTISCKCFSKNQTFKSQYSNLTPKKQKDQSRLQHAHSQLNLSARR